MANERVRCPTSKCGHQVHNRTVSPECGQTQRAQHIQDVEDIEIPSLSHESSHESLDTRIVLDNFSGPGVEPFSLPQCKSLDGIGDGQHGWECVCKVENADSSNHTRQARKIRDTASNDKGDCPEDRDETNPDELAGLGGKWWRSEKLDEDVVVENFDADVTVQGCCDESADHGKYVADCLQTVCGDTQV